MYGYIYKTTNLVNGKIYIGQKKRSYFSTDYKGSGKYLWNAINKYGWSNFKVELLVECNSQDELDSEEIRLIAEYNARDHSIGYNINPGGRGGGYIPTPETRKKLSEALKGNKYFKGHTHTQEWKDDMSKKMKGRTFSKETRKKMSKSAKGRNMTKVNKASADARRGKPLSESTKKKLSIANTGKIRSEETCKKLSEFASTRVGELNPMYGKTGESCPHYGKISVTNGKVSFFIDPKDKDKYLKQGYYLGRHDSCKENSSKAMSKYVYIYDGKEFLGWGKIVEYIRSLGYPKFSQTSLNKIVAGGSVKGYDFLTGNISCRLKDEVSQ